MTTTSIKKGATITATGTETAYTFASDHPSFTTAFLTWISGTFAYAVGPLGGPPIIDGTQTTISAAGSVPVDVDSGSSSIRISGSGTLRIDY